MILPPRLGRKRVAPAIALALAILIPGATGAAGLQNLAPASDQQPVHPVFAFHSGFWINLHHVLYGQARIRAQRSTSGGGGADVADREEAAALLRRGDQHSADWNAAVDYYARDLAGRDLQLDHSLVAINDRLAEMEGCSDLNGSSTPTCASGLRPELIAVLERAAPVYRAHGWEEDDRANRDWIAGVAPLVRQVGGLLSEQLAGVYHSQWPREPIRVDVTSYAGLLGAYTSLDPLHITMSSTDPRNQGASGFELLFHESSHELAGAVFDGIARECRARNMPIPRDLWHAVLFYTTGEVVKRTFENAGAPGAPAYTPYAFRYGLFSRGWHSYEQPIVRYWQPYLDGKVDFDRALARLVAGL
jgi:hypothetical protein